MTWKIWEGALQGITEFVERYEYVDLEFDVGLQGEEAILGTGVLGMKKG